MTESEDALATKKLLKSMRPFVGQDPTEGTI